MIANDFLTHLKESPLVFYIYQRGLEIYGIPNSPKSFLAIVAGKAYKVPKEYTKYKVSAPYMNIQYKVVYKECEFYFIDIKEWFSKVINGEVLCWECACINKKYIYKEYVKLLINTNPYNLRVQCLKYSEDMMNLYNKFLANKQEERAAKVLWEIINRVILTNQIIENHKIVRYNDGAKFYNTIINSSNKIETFNEIYNLQLKKLYSLTDGIVKKIIQDKVIQKK